MSSNLPNINNKLVVKTSVTIKVSVTIEVSVTNTPHVFIMLVCYNKFEKSHKKLDSALAIPFNPISNTSMANHYDLKSDSAVKAFVAEIKHKKNLQLCIYQEPKNKNICYEESNQPNKRICILETDSNTIATLNTIKKNIYDNLLACPIHIQGCLILKDGWHLKLDRDAISLWACAIFTQMNDVDEKTPPKNIITSLEIASSPKPVSSSKPASILQSITVHTKKKSPFKANIHITKDMTFQGLLTFIFPNGPPSGKQFIIKSSLELNRKSFLSNQIIS
ncbi:44991_t:CDS:2 [Gigaspora margarita]|uniref:44991_t:CDS:1 n=1 Tax=Gigaspora margarita TaxID=4874 RepID=A0ABN7V972_GIGMA|nr:44991_t:CDS:2 [Gigaspora margarita]